MRKRAVRSAHESFYYLQKQVQIITRRVEYTQTEHYNSLLSIRNLHVLEYTTQI